MKKNDEEKYEEVNVEGEEFSEEGEESEVEVTEIFLSETEINYWISQLEELREKKSGDIALSLDDESELIINYDDETDDEDSDDEMEDEE